MQILLSFTLLLSLISLFNCAPIEGENLVKNEVIEEKIDSVQKEDAKDGEKHTEKKEEEKDDPQPIIHEEPQREFIPIHKRDADHKPVAEAEVPSMNSDVELQPKSPFDGLNEDPEKAKARIARRVGKKKVTPRPSKA
ncbi:hypothetical protein PRIPAC_86997 [Pristionchus pacificus]|uniref:Uncharacterized protein n=1 Tax=Pristionchus pacificus TaxID=54126 RepID=A0A2A6BLM3_PRIPA|nr:hypothetical protein PRIPAC_86997 [Pristionchus pacificus]|eukprot:PDM66814.1 hypothetical protein PRIPAC_48231 [Pristionchus pacificus]